MNIAGEIEYLGKYKFTTEKLRKAFTKDMKKYLIVAIFMDFFFCGGVRLLLGKENIIDFILVFFMIIPLQFLAFDIMQDLKVIEFFKNYDKDEDL